MRSEVEGRAEHPTGGTDARRMVGPLVRLTSQRFVRVEDSRVEYYESGEWEDGAFTGGYGAYGCVACTVCGMVIVDDSVYREVHVERCTA